MVYLSGTKVGVFWRKQNFTEMQYLLVFLLAVYSPATSSQDKDISGSFQTSNDVHIDKLDSSYESYLHCKERLEFALANSTKLHNEKLKLIGTIKKLLIDRSSLIEEQARLEGMVNNLKNIADKCKDNVVKLNGSLHRFHSGCPKAGVCNSSAIEQEITDMKSQLYACKSARQEAYADAAQLYSEKMEIKCVVSDLLLTVESLKSDIQTCTKHQRESYDQVDALKKKITELTERGTLTEYDTAVALDSEDVIQFLQKLLLEGKIKMHADIQSLFEALNSTNYLYFIEPKKHDVYIMDNYRIDKKQDENVSVDETVEDINESAVGVQSSEMSKERVKTTPSPSKSTTATLPKSGHEDDADLMSDASTVSTERRSADSYNENADCPNDDEDSEVVEGVAWVKRNLVSLLTVIASVLLGVTILGALLCCWCCSRDGDNPLPEIPAPPPSEQFTTYKSMQYPIQPMGNWGLNTAMYMQNRQMTQVENPPRASFYEGNDS